MPLGARELLVILRARDEASRAVHSLSRSMRNMDKDAKKAASAQIERGRAMSSLGVGIMAVGAGGAAMLASWTKEAMEYNQQAAKTLTQVDKQKASLEEIRQIGLRVAQAIPAPMEEMQKSLYDIFSSMDVNLKGAEHLLTQFSKAAVAGQVDLQEASRGTIGILNAYRMGAEGVNRVNDVMFQLVRKGVGTYGEFARTIGRAVPSAVRAGQSVENLSGMLAFLTRNGLSAAMAAASAGRALDAMSHPKTIVKMGELGKLITDIMPKDRVEALRKAGIELESMGVSATDASGKFRNMNDIVTDMGKMFRIAGLSSADMSAVLQEMFKGSGGTIQARRFYDVAIRNFEQLNSLTADMKNSSGALQQAYNIMFKAPQTQMQLLQNNFAAFRIEVGNALIPVLMWLIKVMVGVFKWFNNLSPSTKKLIGYILLAVTALTIIAGAVLTVVGVMGILSAAAGALGIGLATVGWIVLAVIAAIAAIVAIVWLVIKYWKPISGFFIKLWNVIWSVTKAAWDKIWGAIKASWQFTWMIVKTGFTVLLRIVQVSMALVMLPFLLGWQVIRGIFRWFWGWAGGFIKGVFKGFIKAAVDFWHILVTVFTGLWKGIKAVFQWFWKWAGPYIKANLLIIREAFRIVWNAIKTITVGLWNALKGGFNAFWNAIKYGFNSAKTAILKIWDSIKKPMAGPVNFVIDFVWNNGIRKAWNTAVKLVKLPKSFEAPYVTPIKAATGGQVRGPGGPTGDKIPAWLSDQEFVVNAKSTRRYLPILKAINAGAKNIIPGFKNGGLVDAIKGGASFAKDVFFNPKEAIKKLLSFPLKALSKIKDNSWGQLLAHVPTRMVGMLVDGFMKAFDKLGGSGGGGAMGVVNAARRWLGTPYSWGGGGKNGPSYGIGRGAGTWGFDCSGLTEYAWWQGAKKSIGGVTYTQHPNSRRIGGPRPGALGFNASLGHVALASNKPGYVIEAPYTGSFVREIRKSMPDWRWPLRNGGLIDMAIARRLMMGGRTSQLLARSLGIAGDPGGIVPGYRRGRGRVFDTGGYLDPGLHLFTGNFTGQRERVLNPVETRDYERGGSGVTVNVYTNEISPRRHAAQLGWELSERVI